MRTMLQMAVAMAILAVSPAQAQQGMIRGKVTESESSNPLPDANLNLVGTSQGTVTGRDGTFELSASPGTYRLQASLTGYQSAEQSVEVTAGDTVVVDFELVESAPIVEYEFVVVGSKKEKVLDAPASVAVVDAAEIRDRPVLSISEHVKALPGVDQSKTGLTQSNTVIRGSTMSFRGRPWCWWITGSPGCLRCGSMPRILSRPRERILSGSNWCWGRGLRFMDPTAPTV